MGRLPFVDIDQVTAELNVTRQWINRNWFHGDNPPPYFRDGDHVFFELEELQQWAKRRALESASTDTEEDPTD